MKRLLLLACPDSGGWELWDGPTAGHLLKKGWAWHFGGVLHGKPFFRVGKEKLEKERNWRKYFGRPAAFQSTLYMIFNCHGFYFTCPTCTWRHHDTSNTPNQRARGTKLVFLQMRRKNVRRIMIYKIKRTTWQPFQTLISRKSQDLAEKDCINTYVLDSSIHS